MHTEQEWIGVISRVESNKRDDRISIEFRKKGQRIKVYFELVDYARASTGLYSPCKIEVSDLE